MFFHGQALAQQELPVVTAAKPVVRDIVEDDEFVGRFEAVDEVAIRSRVGGYLDEVHFTDGAMVKKGDLLFTIDQRPYQAAYDAAKSQVDVATSLLDFTKMQLERAEELAKTGNISISTLDDRRREYLAAAGADPGRDRRRCRTPASNLEFTEIKAPLSGRIDRRLVSVGNLVQADQTLLTTIVSLDPIDFYFDIDERLYFAYARDARERGGSHAGRRRRPRVTVRIADREDDSLQGQARLRREPHRQATGTMRVRAALRQPGRRPAARHVRPHQRAGLAAASRACCCPTRRSAPTRTAASSIVVDDDGMVSAKPVRTGPRIDGYRVIREGLTGDETIVVNGLMRVRPGVKVKPEMMTLPPEGRGRRSARNEIRPFLRRPADLRGGAVDRPADRRRHRLHAAAGRAISRDRAADHRRARRLSGRRRRDRRRDRGDADRAGDQRRRGHALHVLLFVERRRRWR